jgi:yecA family protein
MSDPLKEQAMSTITEEDIDTLDRFLQERCEDTSGFFSVEMLDGYLAALHVCAQPIPPDQWLPPIWGEGFAFRDEAERETMSELVLALWEDVGERVRAAAEGREEECMPLIAAAPDLDEMDPERTDEFLGLAWSMGFSIAIDLAPEAWDEMCDRIEGLGEDLDQVDELMMIGSEPENSPAITLGRRMEILEILPGLLGALEAHRLDGRKPN